jgi:hypothetical protein
MTPRGEQLRERSRRPTLADRLVEEMTPLMYSSTPAVEEEGCDSRGGLLGNSTPIVS